MNLELLEERNVVEIFATKKRKRMENQIFQPNSKTE